MFPLSEQESATPLSLLAVKLMLVWMPLLLFSLHILTVRSVWDIKPEPPHTRINWVELKTSISPQSDRDLLTFERKLMKFWIQSFLLGVPKIIVGFRDQNGILVRIEEMETEKIPGTVKRSGKATWDGNMCINFAAGFLDCESPLLLFSCGLAGCFR